VQKKVIPQATYDKIKDQCKPDPISLDISPASGGMSSNQGGWNEGEVPEGQTRRSRPDVRSGRG
jgi:hypothetical protein